jgi:hypothetical protein
MNIHADAKEYKTFFENLNTDSLNIAPRRSPRSPVAELLGLLRTARIRSHSGSTKTVHCSDVNAMLCL